MPTKHRRIAVIRDDDLDEALRRVAALDHGQRSNAALVHELAIRGAQALLDEDEDARRRRREAAELLAGPNPPFDREVLANIESLAYGIDE